MKLALMVDYRDDFRAVADAVTDLELAGPGSGVGTPTWWGRPGRCESGWPPTARLRTIVDG